MPSRSRRTRRLDRLPLRLIPAAPRAAADTPPAPPRTAAATAPTAPRTAAPRTRGALALADPARDNVPPARAVARPRAVTRPPRPERPDPSGSPGRVALASPGPVARPRVVVPDDAPVPAGLREAAQLTAQVVADVLTGYRPALQLSGRVTPRLYEALATQLAGGRIIAAARRPIVWRTHICVPATGVAEVAAVAHDDRRAHPIALRLERDRGRWRCVTIAAPLYRGPG
jgi:Family of unknown function (DUF6459)